MAFVPYSTLQQLPDIVATDVEVKLVDHGLAEGDEGIKVTNGAAGRIERKGEIHSDSRRERKKKGYTECETSQAESLSHFRIHRHEDIKFW